jgi:hypothetical protein
MKLSLEQFKIVVGNVLRDVLGSLGWGENIRPAAPRNLPADGSPSPVPAKTFSEREVLLRMRAAADATKAATEAVLEKEFAEEETRIYAEAKRRAEIRAVVGNLERLSKHLPGFNPAGLVEFAEALPMDRTIEFGEEGNRQQKSPREVFLDFAESLPQFYGGRRVRF